MKKELNKGVTLIALVITIIVLLILAGITLALVMGENGIFNKANKASEETNKSQAIEEVRLKVLEVQAEKEGKATLKDVVQKLKDSEYTYTIRIISTERASLSGTVTVEDITDNVTKIGVTNTKYGYEVEIGKNLAIANQVENNTSGNSGGNITSNGKAFGISIDTSGEGTESSPYIVTAKEQLEFLAYLVNSGNTFEGKYIKLGNDITLDSTKSWTPIGNSTTNFQGTFDGNEKTIKDLYINNTSNDQGFFGVIGVSGTIKKLTIEGDAETGYSSGIFAGRNSGTITNCINKATLKASRSVESSDVGGICGNNTGTIYQSANLAAIDGTQHAGGIAGTNSGVISECFNKGTVYCSKWAAGGITGNLCASEKGIFNCYNNASESAAQAPGGGGIVSFADYGGSRSSIYNCYTINNTTIIVQNTGSRCTLMNNYTTDANTKLNELNAGIDEVGGTDTVQPWVADTNNINGGYPILSWQQ